MKNRELDDAYLAFQESERDAYLLDQLDIESLYQDHLDGARDAYLDSLEAGA